MPPLAAPPTVLPSAGGASPSAPPAPIGAAGGSNPSAPPAPLGAAGGSNPSAPPAPLGAAGGSNPSPPPIALPVSGQPSTAGGMMISGTITPDVTGPVLLAGTRNGYPYYTTGGIDWNTFIAGGGGEEFLACITYVPDSDGWEIRVYYPELEDDYRAWTEEYPPINPPPPTPDLVVLWEDGDGTGSPTVTAIAGSNLAAPPAPLGAGGGGGSPGAPPAVVPHAGGVLPGVTLAGALNPDVTGTYIYAGTLNDRGVWSQDGALTPPALGSWARVAYDGTRWQIRVWSDGVLQTSIWSAASGAETLPSSADWTLSAMGTYTGTPVVTTGGALPPPPVVLP